MIKKIIGTVVILIGIAGIGASMYIMDQVVEGQYKIKKAEKTLDQTQQLFSLSPVTKDIGQGIRNSADKKIDAGKETIAQYTQLAQDLKTGGIVAIIIGVVIFIWPQKKRR